MSDTREVMYVRSPSNGLGIAGFVVSLVGLLGGCFGLMVLCPLGLIFSLIALGKPPRGFAIAGTVIGALGSVWLLLAMLLFGGIFAGVLGAAAVLGGDLRQTATVNERIDAFWTAQGRLPADMAELEAKNPTGIAPADLHVQYTKDGESTYTLKAPGLDKKMGTSDDIVTHGSMSTNKAGKP